jgi:hypothetical protein
MKVKDLLIALHDKDLEAEVSVFEFKLFSEGKTDYDLYEIKRVSKVAVPYKGRNILFIEIKKEGIDENQND